MSMPPNAVVAVLVVLFIMVISLAFWKGKKVVERFAHEMFTAKRAEQQHRRQAAGSEASEAHITFLIPEKHSCRVLQKWKLEFMDPLNTLNRDNSIPVNRILKEVGVSWMLQLFLQS
ncbi:hypothetical protein F4801DRAFT_576911 [Xylaria longipes]|nr:hypothetical protein F4801DRAFT_576911 [Xylaria longipes]